MLSISRSRYSLHVQFLFLALNAVGVFLITIYNASTPDMYPGNAHHKLGWILTWVVSAQIVIGVISAYTGRKDNKRDERTTFMSISTEAMEEYQRMQNLRLGESYRFSNDSGQGTEPNTESLRSQSISSRGEYDHPQVRQEPDADDNDVEKQGLMHGSKVDKYLSKKLSELLSRKVLRFLQFFYDVVDRLILILGFAALATGIITYGGLFVSLLRLNQGRCANCHQMGAEVFSGLAHFIKGGVFFWYGILTLGRWAGCFADIGWVCLLQPLFQLEITDLGRLGISNLPNRTNHLRNL